MERVNPPSLAKPSGFSHGVVARGTVLALAGQVGWDREGKIVSHDFARQFERALENLLEVVRAAGGTPESIVKLTAYVTNRDEYVASRKVLGETWNRLLGRSYPAMTLVVVAGLLEPGAKVEIEGWAVL
jgi:enamine deaminase RidA (YjgF/YER057c/UK114 family)